MGEAGLGAGDSEGETETPVSQVMAGNGDGSEANLSTISDDIPLPDAKHEEGDGTGLESMVAAMLMNNKTNVERKNIKAKNADKEKRRAAQREKKFDLKIKDIETKMVTKADLQTEVSTAVAGAVAASTADLQQQLEDLKKKFEEKTEKNGTITDQISTSSWARVATLPRTIEASRGLGTREEETAVLLERAKKTVGLIPVYPSEKKNLEKEEPRLSEDERNIVLAKRFIIENLGLDFEEADRLDGDIVNAFEPVNNVQNRMYAEFKDKTAVRVIWRNIGNMRREAGEMKEIKEYVPGPFMARYLAINEKATRIYKKSLQDHEADSSNHIKRTRIRLIEDDYVLMTKNRAGGWDWVDTSDITVPLYSPAARPGKKVVTGKASMMSESDRRYNEKVTEDRKKRKRDGETGEDENRRKLRKESEVDEVDATQNPVREILSTPNLLAAPTFTAAAPSGGSQLPTLAGSVPARPAACPPPTAGVPAVPVPGKGGKVAVGKQLGQKDKREKPGKSFKKLAMKTNVFELLCTPEMMREESEDETDELLMQDSSPCSKRPETESKAHSLVESNVKYFTERILVEKKSAEQGKTKPTLISEKRKQSRAVPMRKLSEFFTPVNRRALSEALSCTPPEEVVETPIVPTPGEEGTPRSRLEEAASPVLAGGPVRLRPEAEPFVPRTSTNDEEEPEKVYLSERESKSVMEEAEKILECCEREVSLKQAYDDIIASTFHWTKRIVESGMDLKVRKEGGRVTCYTDGSCQGQGKDGRGSGWAGAGVYWAPDSPLNIGLPAPGKQTNNIGELLAICLAMVQGLALKVVKFQIKSDSIYSIKAATVWLKRWKDRNWIGARKKPVLNQEILKTVDLLKGKLERQMSLKFTHVFAHKGTWGNEVADRLANLGADLSRQMRADKVVSQVPVPPRRGPRHQLFGLEVGEQVCRDFGQLLGRGSGAGERRGWGCEEGRLTCKADYTSCEERFEYGEEAEVGTLEEASELMEKHIVEKHIEVLAEAWTTDKYDYKCTGRKLSGGQDELSTLCIVKVDGKICGKEFKTRSQVRTHLRDDHGEKLIESETAGYGMRHEPGRPPRPADQIKRKDVKIKATAKPRQSPRKKRPRPVVVRKVDADSESVRVVNTALMEGNAIQKADISHLTQRLEIAAKENRLMASEIQELKRFKAVSIQKAREMEGVIQKLVEKAVEITPDESRRLAEGVVRELEGMGGVIRSPLKWRQ